MLIYVYDICFYKVNTASGCLHVCSTGQVVWQKLKAPLPLSGHPSFFIFLETYLRYHQKGCGAESHNNQLGV